MHRINALRDWFIENGCEFTGEIADFNSEGLGLMNVTNLKVPRSLFLCKSNILQWSLADEILCGTLSDEMTERQVLMVFLMHVKRHSTRFKLWIDHLPVPNTPLFWSRDSKAFIGLQGTGLDVSCIAKENKLRNEYTRLRTSASFDDFMWADYIFWSRCMSLKSAGYDGDDDYVIVPLIDLCNHSQHPNAHWTLLEDGMRLIPTRSTGQVYISYGTKDNAELLFLHGFSLPDNPMACFKFQAPLYEYATGEEERIKMKLAILQNCGIPSMINLFLPQIQGRSNVGEDTVLNVSQVNGMLDANGLQAMLIAILTEDDPISLTETTERDTFAKELRDSELYPIYILRVVHVLQEVIEYHLDQLKEEMSNKMIEQTRHAIRGILQVCESKLEELKVQYLEDEIVKKYLGQE